MSEPFLGEIRAVANWYAPKNWAYCDGQPIYISQNHGLYALIGTRFGGDGRVVFNLPDLRGRIPLGMGRGSGLDERPLGQMGGKNSVALTPQSIPAHSHSLSVSRGKADQKSPVGNMPAAADNVVFYALEDDHNLGDLGNIALTDTGGGENGATAHENRMPSQGVNFVIALTGTWPERS